MQAPFDLPADLDSPVGLHLRLAPLRPRFLLEGLVGADGARYSLIGLGDGLELTWDRRGVLLGGSREPAPRTPGELVGLLRRALALAPVLGPRPGSAPFGSGGLFGLAGYALGPFLEGLASRHAEELPRVHLLAPRALLVLQHASGCAALATAEEGRPREALRREVRRLLEGRPAVRALPRRARLGPLAAERPEEAFHAAFARAREAIRDGEVYQLVLSERFSAEGEVDPLALYRALRRTPAPHPFLLELGDVRLVGASPEVLARVTGRRAALQPIAGTRPRGADEASDRALAAELEADPKEAAEHVMLVDLARNDLGRVAVPGSVRVEPFRRVERFSHVMHLVSGVAGELLPGRDAFDLFAAAFPAGTVVGAPKARAMELLDELEPCARGAYAGTVGAFGHDGSMEQALAIRTCVVGGGRTTVQAGAGIVAASRPEREYAEIRAKAGGQATALALVGGGC